MSQSIEQAGGKYTVAVVIPAYNIEQYVGRAIESVLAQTRKADEIIVVDRSSDGTAEVVKQYGRQVMYIRQVSTGLAGARNEGIRAATSQWVAFLDGDDEWLPDCLERQMGLAQRNPQLKWLGGNCITCLCDEDRRSPVIVQEIAEKALDGKEYFDDFFEAFVKGFRGNSDTVAVNRAAIIEAGLFREHLLSAEDIDMWLRLGMRWPQFGYLCEPVAIYHLGRMTSIMNAMKIRTRMGHVAALLADNTALAVQTGQLKRFRPCGRHHLLMCIRAWLFNKELAGDIRRLAGELDKLLTPADKMTIWIMTVWPWGTEKLLRAISYVVRTLKLRRLVVARPQKSANI
jgi:glycosyltransferase involved in cell wall biosynthesis